MTVKQLIEESNFKRVWQYLCDDFYKYCDFSSEQIESFKRKMANAASIMRTIQPKTDNDYIVVVSQYYDDLELGETLHMSSDLYKKSEIREKFKEDPVIEDKIDTSGWNAQDVKVYLVSLPYIPSYGFEFADWDDVLGYEVFLESVDKYSIDRCAAAVLFEMTYGGFTPEEKKERNEALFNKKTNVFKRTWLIIKNFLYYFYSRKRMKEHEEMNEHLNMCIDENKDKIALISLKINEIKYRDIKAVYQMLEKKEG